MKRSILTISLAVIAVVAVALIFSSLAAAEKGWPLNEGGEPADGGNWQGEGQLNNPIEGIQAEWYNTTKNDSAWVIENGDDILRSFSAFDYKFDLTIQNGGILRLDSVAFDLNNSEDRKIVVEDGGTLYVTNSSMAFRELIVEDGGALYFAIGNGTNSLSINIPDAPGIHVSQGSTFELRNSSVSGQTTLLTIEDPGAVVDGNQLGTTGNGEACIHLKASAPISNNQFWEYTPTGSYAIIAEKGVASQIYNNTFSGFKHGGSSIRGRAIMSFGPIEIYDNFFTEMWMTSPDSDPYVIYFVGAEPTDHDGEPVWETNRFRGDNDAPNNERVNIFKQAWFVEVTVKNKNTGNPIEDANVVVHDTEDNEVGDEMTDESGVAYFEITEYYVSALDDGLNGDSDKSNAVEEFNPFDIEGSKAGESDSLEDQTIDQDRQFEIELDLVEFDYGVSNLQFDDQINAGDNVNFDASVFNNGYDRDTDVTVEFFIVDATRGESKLGEDIVLVNLDMVHARLDALIPLIYANTNVTFKAMTTFGQDSDTSNDAFESEVTHINEKPKVFIAEPDDGETFSGIFTVAGTASDDVMVSEVQLNITGVLDWTTVSGTTAWNHDVDTSSMANGLYELNVRSKDSNGTYSDVATITFNVQNTPTISITSPGDGSLIRGNDITTMLGATQKLQAAILSVTITIDGGAPMDATMVTGWSQWKFPLKTNDDDNINSLSDGHHVFTATVMDDDGLSDSVSVTYTIYSTAESTKPVVEISTDPGFDLKTATWVKGNATDDYKVTGIQFRINDGGWQAAEEFIDTNPMNTTWRVRIQPAHTDLVPLNNILYVRAFDDDANTTALLPFNVPLEGAVDLTIGGVVLMNKDDLALKADELRVDNTIKIVVTINVVGSGETLPQVAVRLYIGGKDAATETALDKSGQFDVIFQITLKASQKGEENFAIVVDPANIIDETNDDGNAEDNNRYDDKFIGKILPPEGEDNGGSGGFIPGFEVVALITGLGVAGLIGSLRKRRD